mmetsp:Transcript_30683/g.77653  ORF Transcript_30683/g.77653 Transcript_30683/m.77653 type:complete len:272 (-) Transcript_30683:563-1378(-)
MMETPTLRSMTRRSSSALTVAFPAGLAMKPSKPVATHSSRTESPTSAVKATTGMRGLMSRMSLAAFMPSITGILRSIKMMSYRPVLLETFWTASRPLLAVSTVQPSLWTRLLSTLRQIMLSSTTSALGLALDIATSPTGGGLVPPQAPRHEGGLVPSSSMVGAAESIVEEAWATCLRAAGDSDTSVQPALPESDPEIEAEALFFFRPVFDSFSGTTTRMTSVAVGGTEGGRPMATTKVVSPGLVSNSRDPPMHCTMLLITLRPTPRPVTSS